MTILQLIRRLWITATWSTRPEWISPPLRKTRFRRGHNLRRVWAHRSFKRPDGAKTYIGLGSIDVSYLREKTEFLSGKIRVEPESCRDILSEALGLPPYQALSPESANDRVYRLDLAIVEARPGSLFLRSGIEELAWRHWRFLLLLGFGHAWVQIEGMLTDRDRELEVLKFVERRRSTGSSRSSSWFGETWGDVLVRELIEGIAQDALQELYRQLTGSKAS